MKVIIYILIFCTTSISLAQEKWITETGNISFEASIPLFEEVNAINNSVKCVLNTKEKTIVCVLKIKDFDFKRDLMETHFNEIYLESDRYPKATFKGTIPNLEIAKISSVEIILPINGKIKIHGITQPLSIKGKFKKTQDNLQLTADFELNTDDFKIEIPSMILPKVSKIVKSHIDFTLE
jgi:hypothetical protein